MSKTQCAMCERRLSEGEIDFPYAPRGEVICESCRLEEYTFDCCRCGGVEEKTERDCVGALLVVARDLPNLAAGIYRIERWPYWSYADVTRIEEYLFAEAGIGTLYPESLKLVSKDIGGCQPEDYDHGGGKGQYACGDLCCGCAAEILEAEKRAADERGRMRDGSGARSD